MQKIWIVAMTNPLTGAMFPSGNPFQHDSRKSAEAEAERLAAVDPAWGFTVLEAVSFSKTQNVLTTTL